MRRSLLVAAAVVVAGGLSYAWAALPVTDGTAPPPSTEGTWAARRAAALPKPAPNRPPDTTRPPSTTERSTDCSATRPRPPKSRCGPCRAPTEPTQSAQPPGQSPASRPCKARTTDPPASTSAQD